MDFHVFSNSDFYLILQRFLNAFLMEKGHKMGPDLFARSSLFDDLFRTSTFICILVALCLPFGSLFAALGRFWHPCGSTFVAFGAPSASFWTILAPPSPLLAPFWIKIRKKYIQKSVQKTMPKKHENP